MTKYAQALAALLPRGYAWPRDPGSVLMQVIQGLGLLLQDVEDFALATVEQWQPRTTTTRLAEWEASCGLPDACFGDDQSETQRRASLLRRLRGAQLLLDDSSPASPAAIEALIADIGYQATARYWYPMRVGRDRVGDRLGRLDGQLVITVDTAGSEPLRVGTGRVGSRLVIRPGIGTDLECYLNRMLPARFGPVYIYTSTPIDYD